MPRDTRGPARAATKAQGHLGGGGRRCWGPGGAKGACPTHLARQHLVEGAPIHQVGEVRDRAGPRLHLALRQRGERLALAQMPAQHGTCPWPSGWSRGSPLTICSLSSSIALACSSSTCSWSFMSARLNCHSRRRRRMTQGWGRLPSAPPKTTPDPRAEGDPHTDPSPFRGAGRGFQGAGAAVGPGGQWPPCSAAESPTGATHMAEAVLQGAQLGLEGLRGLLQGRDVAEQVLEGVHGLDRAQQRTVGSSRAAGVGAWTREALRPACQAPRPTSYTWAVRVSGWGAVPRKPTTPPGVLGL